MKYFVMGLVAGALVFGTAVLAPAALGGSEAGALGRALESFGRSWRAVGRARPERIAGDVELSRT